MNIKTAFDLSIQDHSATIIEALDNQTVPLLSNNPLKYAMIDVFGGCPPEVRRSVIDNAMQYGLSEDNALYGSAVFDLFDTELKPKGAIFVDPTNDDTDDIIFGYGSYFFNRSKLNESPLIMTNDITLAFKTAYPVYLANARTATTASTVADLLKMQPELYFVTPIHQKQDIQRRFTDLKVNLVFIPEPPSIVMSQAELDNMIQTAIDQAKHQEWGEIIPLAQTEAVACNPYPIHAVPPLAREAILAIAEHVQAPIAMTAQCVIGAMSHIAQAKVNAPHPFNANGEPCSLYLLTEGQSGSRKSTSRNLADRAIINYEREQYKLYRRDMEQWKSGLEGLNKKDREAFGVENPSPHDPSTLYSDITLESLAGLYVDGVLKNASIASDEAAQFFGGHTMKGDTRNQALGGYAKLFDDGSVERTRSKSNLNGSGRAYDVRLTFNLQGQREVLADALKDPVLRGQGFLPRFILTIPENLAGTRLQDAIYQSKNANLDHRLIAYWTRCGYLLDDCPQPQTGKEMHNGRYIIPMNDDARAIDLEFYNLFEQLQGKGKQYEYLQAFASRASQLARRLATVFAYFEGLQWIDAKTLKGACEIVKYSLDEWGKYAEVEVKAESDAERLTKWLIKKCMNSHQNSRHT